MDVEVDDRRRAQLLTSLASVRTRLVDAARAVDRDPRDITLVAVTKTFPLVDAATLLELGVRDLGESRDQEAKAKAAELPADVRWHFVGRLQTNKCRSVAGYASVVHSVDRVEVAEALAVGIERAGREPLRVFAQVSLDADPERGGVTEQGLLELADQIAAQDELVLLGVMAVAPMGLDPNVAFDRLAQASTLLQREHPEAVAISAGMSQDFEQAIRHGATHVRVGSALLGRRTTSFG